MDPLSNPYASPISSGRPVEAAAADMSPVWFARVARGLGTFFTGTLLLLSTDVAGYTLRMNFPLPYQPLLLGWHFMILAAAAWNFVGLMMCRTAPEKPSIQIRIHLALASTLLVAGSQVLALLFVRGVVSNIPDWSYYLSWLASPVSYLVIGLYLERLAHLIRDAGLVRRARIACTAATLSVVAVVLYGLNLWSDAQAQTPTVTGILRLTTVIWWCVTLGVFMWLAADLRKALLRREQASAADVIWPRPELNPDAAWWLFERPASLSRMATGLWISNAGIVVVLLANSAPATLAIAPELEWMRAGIIVGIYLLIVIGRTLKLVGTLLCLATPEELDSRGLIQIAIVVTLMSLIFEIAAGLARSGVTEPPPMPLECVAGILGFVWDVLFLLYLKRLTLFIGRSDLVRWIQCLLIAVIVIVPSRLVIFEIVRSRPSIPASAMFAIMTAHGLLFYCVYAVFIPYVKLIRRIRRSVLRRE